MKRALCIAFITLIALSMFFVTASAASGGISASNASGSPGNSVNISVVISDNPGVIAMRLSIGYDASRLKLISVSDGGLFGSGTANFGKDTLANPYVLTWEDALAKKNYTNNGTLVTLEFLILDTAATGNAAITLNLDSGSTFNVDLQNISFKVTNGSVTVKNGSNPKPGSTQTLEATTVCKHKDSKWITVKDADCTTDGKKKRVCSSCGMTIEVGSIPATGHKMGSWSVKTAATSTQDGTELRKCSVCGYVETRIIPKLTPSAVSTTVITNSVNNPDDSHAVALTGVSDAITNGAVGEANEEIEQLSMSSNSDTVVPDSTEKNDSKTKNTENGPYNERYKWVMTATFVLLIIALIFVAIYNFKKSRKEHKT